MSSNNNAEKIIVQAFDREYGVGCPKSDCMSLSTDTDLSALELVKPHCLLSDISVCGCALVVCSPNVIIADRRLVSVSLGRAPCFQS